MHDEGSSFDAAAAQVAVIGYTDAHPTRHTYTSLSRVSACLSTLNNQARRLLQVDAHRSWSGSDSDSGSDDSGSEWSGSESDEAPKKKRGGAKRPAPPKRSARPKDKALQRAIAASLEPCKSGEGGGSSSAAGPYRSAPSAAPPPAWQEPPRLLLEIASLAPATPALRVLAARRPAPQPPLVPDGEDWRTGNLFFEVAGAGGVSETIGVLQSFESARLRNDEYGRLIRLMLERLKSQHGPHRTRAEGYAAERLFLQLCESSFAMPRGCCAWSRRFRVWAAQLRERMPAACRDAPQLLRTVSKRAGTALCLDEATLLARIRLPKCLYGMFAALHEYVCFREQSGRYLRPEERTALVARFLEKAQTTAAGAALLLTTSFARLEVVVTERVDERGESVEVPFVVKSDPADYQRPPETKLSVFLDKLPRGDATLLELLVRLRRGEVPGCEPAATWRESETWEASVKAVLGAYEQWLYDGKCVFFGRSITVDAVPAPAAGGSVCANGDATSGAARRRLIDRSDSVESGELQLGWLKPLPAGGQEREQEVMRRWLRVPEPRPPPRESAISVLRGELGEAKAEAEKRFTDDLLSSHLATANACKTVLGNVGLAVASLLLHVGQPAAFGEPPTQLAVRCAADGATTASATALLSILAPSDIDQLMLAAREEEEEEEVSKPVARLSLERLERLVAELAEGALRSSRDRLASAAGGSSDGAPRALLLRLETANDAVLYCARSPLLLGNPRSRIALLEPQCSRAVLLAASISAEPKRCAAAPLPLAALASELRTRLQQEQWRASVAHVNGGGMLVCSLASAAEAAAEGKEGAEALLQLLLTQVASAVADLHHINGAKSLVRPLVLAAEGAAEGEKGAEALLQLLLDLASVLGPLAATGQGRLRNRHCAVFSSLPSFVSAFLRSPTNVQTHVVTLLRAAGAAAGTEDAASTFEAVVRTVLEGKHAACLRLSAPAASLLRELAAQRVEAPPAGQPAAPSGSAPQLKAAQAKVNSHVVVVYEEEDGGGAVVKVLYAGVVTKVAAAQGMRVRFDEGGGEMWVDERAGDEWWYETSPKPPASRDGASAAMASAVSDEGVVAAAPTPPAAAGTAAAGTAAAGAVQRRWTPSDDAALRHQVELLGHKWREVSSQLPGTSASSCKNRLTLLQRAEKKAAAGEPSRQQNVPWTVAEENLLARAVEPYLTAASIDYSTIRSSYFAYRTKVEVMAKWQNMCAMQKRRLTGQKRRR